MYDELVTNIGTLCADGSETSDSKQLDEPAGVGLKHGQVDAPEDLQEDFDQDNYQISGQKNVPSTK